MTQTARVEELLRLIEEQGFWTAEQVWEIYEMTGRDAGYMPEGTEDWMQEDGVPRAYDRPRRRVEAYLKGKDLPLDDSPEVAPIAHTYDLPTDDDVAKVRDAVRLTQDVVPDSDIDARLKTIEATLTDLMRRLKALEERAIGS